VVEHALDLDDEGQRGPMPVDDEVVEERGLAHERRATVDAQRVAAAGHDEEQPDVGVLEHVVPAVDAAVAGPVRDRHRRLVDHEHGAGGVALGRHGAPAGGVRRRDEHERGRRDPGAVDGVQHRPDLVAGSR
jgi:hypothetical protein